MSKVKSIGIFIPSFKNGGVERVASNLSIYLDEEIDKVLITYLDDIGDFQFDGRIVSLKSKLSKNPIKILFNLIKKYKEIKKIKRREKFDICISMVESPNVMNVLTKGNERTYISIHSNKSFELGGVKKKLNQIFLRYFYNKADKIIVVSEGIKEDLVNNFGINQSKIKVIYNSIDTLRIEKLKKEKIESKELDLFNEGSTIINVGRLSKAKGQWHLIRAFSHVSKIKPEAKLIIIGEGELRVYFEELIKSFKLENKVHLLGNKANPFKYMDKADVFGFSSIWEGFGLALVEALACGLPVVSSNCNSGPSEILGNKTLKTDSMIQYCDYGLLVPVCDGKFYLGKEDLTIEEYILAEALLKLLDKNSLQKKYKESSLKRAIQFQHENIINKWIN